MCSLFRLHKVGIQIQSESEIRPFEIRKHLKSWLFEGRISNGPVFIRSGFSYQPLEIRTFLSGFQIVFDKMAGICPDFKWLGFQISDPQVVINCRFSVAQMCTREDILAHYLGMPSLDDVMSHSELTTQLIQCKMHYGRSKKVLHWGLSEPLNIIK